MGQEIFEDEKEGGTGPGVEEGGGGDEKAGVFEQQGCSIVVVEPVDVFSVANIVKTMKTKGGKKEEEKGV